MRYKYLSKQYLIEKLKNKDKLIKKLYREKNILKYYASFDTMTKALNKRSGISILNKEIIKSKYNGKTLVICYIDIDRLKYINDKFGHHEGDRVLINVGNIIRKNIRESDLFIRLGGDEFLVVFTETSLKNSKNILNRIETKIKQLNRIKNNKYNIAFSYGFAQLNKKVGMKNLIKRADREMYKKKKLKYKVLKKDTEYNSYEKMI